MEHGENYLGIDWGAAKVGVALAHAETRVAVAYATLRNDAGLLDRLGAVIAKEGVGTVVIGIPSYVNRVEGVSAGERLGVALGKRFGVAIAYQDEMFTTKLAQRNLIEKRVKGVSKHDDEEAARIILAEWLERQAF